jgi:uncharacterized membrane protein YphA (DoxX/SURF4 family)
MGAQVAFAPVEGEARAAAWSPARRVAFRFCFVYLGLFCISTQIFGGFFPVSKVEIPALASRWPMRQITFWTAAHIFHAKLPLVYSNSGSGDKTFDWVLSFWLLAVAAVATGIASTVDRKRQDYGTLYKWFRLFIRFALASEMLLYGMDKLVPLQMPFPSLLRLLEPFHDFSPMGVLWYSIGASPAYEIFAGCAEVLGGVLLIFPRTTMLGALVSLADLTQVFALNMTYDVPVKLFSFHLLLLAVFLLASEFERLADFFFSNRAVAPSMQAELFQTRRANRFALVAQIVLGLWLIGANAYSSWDGWYTYGGGHPKSPLYGIWDVEQLAIDGQVRSPLLNDYDRWHRAIFDPPTRVAFQRMDDSFARYGAAINSNDRTIALTNDSDKSWKANFTFQRAAQDQLTMDGEMDGHRIHMQLRLVDLNKYLLVSRGFHWIQEYPFNR